MTHCQTGKIKTVDFSPTEGEILSLSLKYKINSKHIITIMDKTETQMTKKM